MLAQLMTLLEGRMGAVVNKHDGGRVVQSVSSDDVSEFAQGGGEGNEVREEPAEKRKLSHVFVVGRPQIVKHGGKKEREAVAVELKGRFVELVQSKYSKVSPRYIPVSLVWTALCFGLSWRAVVASSLIVFPPTPFFLSCLPSFSLVPRRQAHPSRTHRSNQHPRRAHAPPPPSYPSPRSRRNHRGRVHALVLRQGAKQHDEAMVGEGGRSVLHRVSRLDGLLGE